MTGDSLAEARDLSVHFRVRRRSVHALDGVSLDWRRNETVGIVGESGCGKSTLARAILGLVQPSAGTIVHDGRPVSGARALTVLRRRIQMVFQDPYQTLNPRQRVSRIVSEPMVVQRIPRSEREQRARRALADVGLDPERYLDRYPHQLSGGQRQRVAIAAALVLEPEGLICDEPVSMLDASIRSQILALLLAIKRSRGLGLIFITHDLSLAWSVCDRIAVMYLGRIVEQGRAAAVIESPRHPYTEALVAAVPSLAADRRAERRQALSGDLPDATDIPPGCRFHPRCPKRFEPCDTVDPDLYPTDDRGQLAACLLHTPDPVR